MDNVSNVRCTTTRNRAGPGFFNSWMMCTCVYKGRLDSRYCMSIHGVRLAGITGVESYWGPVLLLLTLMYSVCVLVNNLPIPDICWSDWFVSSLFPSAVIARFIAA
jgi:hypothetical protein